MAREEIMFTAQTARNNANNSFSTLKRIFKLIAELSKENGVELVYNFDTLSQSAAQSIVSALEQNDYKVEIQLCDKDVGEFVSVSEIKEDLIDGVFVIRW